MTDQPHDPAEPEAEVSKRCPDTGSSDTSPVDPQSPETVRRRGGAPAGNLNAGTHLLRSRKSARELRDRHVERVQAEIREALKLAGLSKDPLARIVGRAVVRLEAAASRLEAHMQARGYFTTGGDPKPGLKTLMDLNDRLLGEARRLLDQLREIRQTDGKKGDRWSGPLPITIASEPAVAIPVPCESCGHVPGTRRSAPAQGDLSQPATDSASLAPDASSEPVAPRRLGDLFTVEPLPVVVEPPRPRRVEHVGFDREEREVETWDPRRIQF